MGLSLDEIRAMVLALPGVEEGPCYGTPGFRVRGKLLARLKVDGQTLVVRVGFDEREMLMQAERETFFITDHYRNYDAVLVRLASVAPGTLQRLLEQHWRAVAPKKLVAGYSA